VGLPVEVTEREPGDQARSKQLVDIVGIVVLNWRSGVRRKGQK
jgi:hypothetical protein